MTELERTYDFGPDWGRAVVLVDSSGTPISSGGTGASAGQVQGNAASGAADAGNPVKIGGVFNSTLPTVTTGQRVDLQSSNWGAPVLAQRITVTDAAPNLASQIINGIAGQAPSFNSLAVYGYKCNGTTWDRDRKANASSVIPSSAASVNATVAKATPGDLHNVIAYNTTAGILYLKFYNKTTAPTVGTDTPVLVFALSPLGVTHIPLAGHYFSLGIGYALTGLPANADTTAVAVGDVVGLTVTYA